MNYLDFVLHIKSDKSITSTFDGKDETSTLELSDDIIKFKDKLARREESITKEHVIDFGKDLRKVLFKDKIDEQFKKAMDLARENEYGVRILLDVAPEFIDYPWEVMSNDVTCLATNTSTPVVRIFPGNSTKQVNLQDKPPTTFFILSGPTGEYAINTVGEMKKIKQAFGDKQQIEDFDRVEDGIRANIKLDDTTKENIFNVISKHPFNIVHFVGHGIFEDGTGFLALRKEDGTLDKVNEDDISKLFQNAKSLVLVILNACSTAKISNNFTGLVPKLLNIVPAVIAMRQPISNTAAKSFASGLYSTLLSDRIEAAVQNARNWMYVDENCKGGDFSIPVLYLNRDSAKAGGKIFTRTYDETQIVRRPPESGRPNIARSLTDLHELYLAFKEIVNAVEDDTDATHLAKHHFFWKPTLNGLKGKYELIISEFCSVFPTGKNTLLEKSEPLLHKLDALSSSMRSGSEEKIKNSWEEIAEEYSSIEDLFSHIMTPGSEVN